MKRLLFLSMLLMLLNSCYKTDPEVLNLLLDIKEQNDVLKNQISALQKTTDSLSYVLKTTNSNVLNLGFKIDSLKSQITNVLQQINILNTQLITANANILDIQAKITELQKKCIELYSLLNDYINKINLTNGLVAYYPFNNTLFDSTLNNNHGTINGNVSITSDRFGNQKSAYMFNGGNIVIPHRQYLNINQAGEFTFSIWVNKTGNQNPVHILGKRANRAQQFNWQFGEHITPGGAVGGGLVFTGVTGSNPTGIDYNGITDATLTMNNWDHIVGTHNNGKWVLYKNGVIVSEKISSLSYTDNSNPSFEIGNSGGWGAFYGKIDDLRIYNRELSKNEITQLYNLKY